MCDPQFEGTPWIDIRLSHKSSDKLAMIIFILQFLNDNSESFEICPIGIDGLLPMLGQIVNALALEGWELALGELLQCHFDVVAGLKVLTIQMTLKMGKKVVIRGIQV